jgi:hypothetical protein
MTPLGPELGTPTHVPGTAQVNIAMSEGPPAAFAHETAELPSFSSLDSHGRYTG